MEFWKIWKNVAQRLEFNNLFKQEISEINKLKLPSMQPLKSYQNIVLPSSRSSEEFALASLGSREEGPLLLAIFISKLLDFLNLTLVVMSLGSSDSRDVSGPTFNQMYRHGSQQIW